MATTSPSSHSLSNLLNRLGKSQYLGAIIFGSYVVLVIGAIWHHEPWADEAHAWLLARDARLLELWTRLLRYEGSPGLWHTLLVLLNKLGLPYRSEGVLSGLLGCSAVWLLLTRSPFPKELQILLPFTFFFAYQYVVVARSYSLIPLLLFACLVIYKRAAQKIYLLTFLLALLALVSVHGLLLSGSLWTMSQYKVFRMWGQLGISARKRTVVSAIGYVLVLFLVVYSTWPPNDVSFPAHAQVSIGRILKSANLFLTEGFSGNLYVTLLLLALSAPFLYRGGGLPLFLISLLSIVAFGGVVYSQVWHSGTVFIGWLGAMWISTMNTKLSRVAYVSLAAIILIQCSWTFMSISYDWFQPYSGSKEAAEYLRSTGAAKLKPLAFGYSCTAIQPYFSSGVFSNYPAGRGYWDWSTRNRANEPGPLFSAQSSEYVVVGYKALSDMDWLTPFLRLSGYNQVKHFPGRLYWRNSTFEEESFDVYRRSFPPAAVSNSFLSMADPAITPQLISGFYNVEGNGWRWTARQFSVLLKSITAKQTPVQIEVHLFISPDQFKLLGPMTLKGDVNGHQLKPEIFTEPGNYVYKQSLPPSEVDSAFIFGNFSFEKAVPAGMVDGRELAAVVSAIGLRSEP